MGGRVLTIQRIPDKSIPESTPIRGLSLTSYHARQRMPALPDVNEANSSQANTKLGSMSTMEPVPNVLSITVEHEPAIDVTRALFDGLSRANVERIGDGKIEHLCVTARHSSKALAGGLYGELYWGWLNILALWVSPDLRRQGLGSQLLTRAEAEACAKGCRGVYLDTFTFQDVALYTRAGYEIFGTLEHFPSGHSRHFLSKRLPRVSSRGDR